MVNLKLVSDTVGIVSALNEEPIDFDFLSSELDLESKKTNEIAIMSCLKKAGFKVSLKSSKKLNLEKLPKLSILINESGEVFFNINQKDGYSTLHSVEKNEKIEVSTSELSKRFQSVILMKKSRLSASESYGISWFFSFFKKHKKHFYEIIAASFFIQILALVTPFFFQITIDKVVTNQAYGTLTVLVIAFVAATIFDAALGYLRTYLLSHTTSRVDSECSSAIYSHLLDLPISYFKTRRVGEIVTRIKEIDSVRSFLTNTGMLLTIDVLFLFVFLVVLFNINSSLFLVVLVSIPVYILIAIAITPMLKSKLEENFAQGAENHSFLVESISGSETIKSNAIESKFKSKWNEKNSDYIKTKFESSQLSNLFNTLTQGTSKITGIAILYFGAGMVIESQITVGQLIAFNMIAGRVSQPILKLAQVWQDFQQAIVGLNRVGDIMKTPREFEPSKAMSKEKFTGHILLKKISYRYNGSSEDVIKNLSMQVKPGENVAIVGSSGSGKSTLYKLINRLFAPSKGRVYIDGIDTTSLDSNKLRQRIGVVQQDSTLFKGSLIDNLTMKSGNKSIKEIIEACTVAGCHDFISEFPNGYGTELGENGDGLSGGQKQRIVIARTLLSDPDILIFDEATSALDYESERAILNNLELISEGKSFIMITHRLASIEKMDKIVVMDKGEIVESGSFEQLVSKGGQFSKLWSIHNEG